MRRRSIRLAAPLLPLLLPVFACAQLVVTELGGQSPDVLVNALLGSDVTYSNVAYQGNMFSSGTFSGGGGIVGFEGGVLLGSGPVTDVRGPNLNDDYDDDLGLGGDADLSALCSNPTYDATVLEFDFVPTNPWLNFQYVFASEEYNEYVFQYNDVFAFYLNGTNVALVPNTAMYVSIDNVNLSVNPSFFVNNEYGPLNTELDGLTAVLNVVAPVVPNVTNHIKLAVADAVDSYLSSYVFIRANSFASIPSPTPTVIHPTPTPVPGGFFNVSRNVFQPGEDAPDLFARVGIHVAGTYRLYVYNSAGELVRVLRNLDLTAVPWQEDVVWDGKNDAGEPVAAGVYLFHLETTMKAETRRVLLLR